MMSYIHAQVWVMGAPKCSSAGCSRLILNYDQAVVIVRNQGNVGFCSHRCFQEAFRPDPAPEPPREEADGRDLLHLLGYRHLAEESDAA